MVNVVVQNSTKSDYLIPQTFLQWLDYLKRMQLVRNFNKPYKTVKKRPLKYISE